MSGRFSDWWILFLPALISAVVTPLFCLAHWWLSRTHGLSDLKKLGKLSKLNKLSKLRPRARTSQRRVPVRSLNKV